MREENRTAKDSIIYLPNLVIDLWFQEPKGVALYRVSATGTIFWVLKLEIEKNFPGTFYEVYVATGSSFYLAIFWGFFLVTKLDIA